MKMEMKNKVSELELRDAISKYLKLDVCQITYCYYDNTGCVVMTQGIEIKIEKGDVIYALEKYLGYDIKDLIKRDRSSDVNIVKFNKGRFEDE